MASKKSWKHLSGIAIIFEDLFVLKQLLIYETYSFRKVIKLKTVLLVLFMTAKHHVLSGFAII